MPRPIPWRRDLAAPLHAIQSELNRMFEEYWNPIRSSASQPPPTDLEPAGWSPAIDVFETPTELVLVAELPGVEPSSIDLSVTGNVLSLRGEKPTDGAAESSGTIRERLFGTFHRQVVLPNEVNFEGAQAESKNGVLRVRLPKKEAARPRTIPVKTG
jgi:HSP20 family protein